MILAVVACRNFWERSWTFEELVVVEELEPLVLVSFSSGNAILDLHFNSQIDAVDA